MRMPQPPNFAAHSVFTRDGRVVLHNHVEVRTNEPEWRAVDLEQGVEIQPFPVCQFHKSGAVARKEFVDFSEDRGLIRDRRNLDRFCYTHRRHCSLRLLRYARNWKTCT